MLKTRRGNILMITFLLLTSLAIVVGGFAYLMTAVLKKNSSDIDYLKCLYYAEAGMAKAVWYLKTPTYDGGRGSSWRTTTGLIENFGSGSYKMIVQDGTAPFQINIGVTGYAGTNTRTVQASYYSYPPAFVHAIFSTQKTKISTGSRIAGSCFMDNDVTVEGGAIISNGYLYLTSGHTVSGGGSYTLGPVPNPVPAFPTLDSSYYNSQLTQAAAQSPGSRSYSFIKFLNNSSTYVNGDIDIYGFIIGPGDMVATGNLTVNDGAYVSDNINLIANQKLMIDRNSNLGNNDVLYSNTRIDFQDHFFTNSLISAICPNVINVYSPNYLSGIIYGGQVFFDTNTTFLGTIMAGNTGIQNNFGNNFRSYNYYPGYQLPTVPPPGIPFMTLIQGSWKETP